MLNFNATVEFAARVSEAQCERLVEQLADYHPATGRSLGGRQDVTITVPADTLRQAVSTGLAVAEAAGFSPWGIEVLPTDEFDRRLGLAPLPTLLSVTEAATALGVTRQAIQQRIDSGSLPAQRVGNSYAIPHAAITDADARQATPHQDGRR